MCAYKYSQRNRLFIHDIIFHSAAMDQTDKIKTTNIPGYTVDVVKNEEYTHPVLRVHVVQQTPNLNPYYILKQSVWVSLTCYVHCVRKLAFETCVLTVIQCIVKKLTVHASCITSIRGRTDSKFKSLLHIIETKCVSEFDMLVVFGEEISIGNVRTYSNTV